MFTSLTDILVPIFYSFSIAFVLVYVSMKISIKLGLVDNPQRNHPAATHTQAIPRTGGIALWLAFSIVSLSYLEPTPLLIGLLIGGGMNASLGILDDLFSLSPLPRLLVQIASSCLVIVAGVSFYTANPFGEGLWYYDLLTFTINGLELVVPSDLILIVWIVWIMNTTNWTKGASQLPGVATIAFLTLGGVALQYQAGNVDQERTAMLAFIAAGSTFALFPFNFPPEKLFPNFGASTFIGFNLAVLSILSGGKIATLLIVFSLPVIDALLVAVKRMINHKSPLVHDREHFYHLLMDRGWGKRRVIYLYLAVSALLAIFTLLFTTLLKVLLIALLLLVISFLFISAYRKNKTTQ